ncbi:MAG: ABC transporter permease [Chloroflexi bacterium]|nr:ABC transporter permease [Chloroflexota bacterium]
MHSVSHWLASVGWGLLALFALAAILAPWLSSHDPSTMDGPMLPPSASHPLGTNDIGQDIFSELLYGARFSLLVGCLAAGLSTAIGVVLGVVAGYYDKLGFAIMRVVDVFLAVPRFPLIVFLAAFLKPGFWTLVLFFLLFGWTKTTRLVRSQILSERHNGYVEAAVAVGAGDLRILVCHLLPGTLSIALVRFIVEFQHVILAESGLSFLGLGDPTVKSWGAILRYAFEYPTIFISNVWVRWAAPPGICITLVVLALTFVGFSLEEWANPRLSGARRRAWWNRPNDQ